MLKPQIKAWLDKNASGYDVNTTTEGGLIIFVSSQGGKAVRAYKYFQRYHKQARMEWRASHHWLAIIFPKGAVNNEI